MVVSLTPSNYQTFSLVAAELINYLVFLRIFNGKKVTQNKIVNKTKNPKIQKVFKCILKLEDAFCSCWCEQGWGVLYILTGRFPIRDIIM